MLDLFPIPTFESEAVDPVNNPPNEPFDPDLESFVGDLLAEYWPLLPIDSQQALRSTLQNFMLSRLRLPAFFHIGQVEAAYPSLYEFLKNTAQEVTTGCKMTDSLHCECGGEYQHLDQQQDDSGVLDTYQCNGCSTFCLITWDPGSERELKRVYTTAAGEPL